MSTPPSFWCLRAPDQHRPAEWDPSVDLEEANCPITNDHQGGGDRIGPLRIVLASSRIDDFVWTWYSECIIQDRVLNRLREAGVTGFDVAPVQVTKVRLRRGAAGPAAELPPLWELKVIGWAGEAPTESGIRMRYYCEGCGLTDYTACKHADRLIDPGQWDGSDIFIVWPLPKFIFVTDRVADIIRQEGYTGVRLVRPADMDICDGTGFGPGPPPPGRKVRGPEAFPKVRIRHPRAKRR
jgi:hypothetical protein